MCVCVEGVRVSVERRAFFLCLHQSDGSRNETDRLASTRSPVMGLFLELDSHSSGGMSPKPNRFLENTFYICIPNILLHFNDLHLVFLLYLATCVLTHLLSIQAGFFGAVWMLERKYAGLLCDFMQKQCVDRCFLSNVTMFLELFYYIHTHHTCGVRTDGAAASFYTVSLLLLECLIQFPSKYNVYSFYHLLVYKKEQSTLKS